MSATEVRDTQPGAYLLALEDVDQLELLLERRQQLQLQKNKYKRTVHHNRNEHEKGDTTR